MSVVQVLSEIDVGQKLSQRKAEITKMHSKFDYNSHNLTLTPEDETSIKNFYYSKLCEILDQQPNMMPDVKYSALLMFSKVLDQFPLYCEDLFYTMFACLYLVSKSVHWTLKISMFIESFQLSEIKDIESKLIQEETKIIQLIDFSFSFPNPIESLRGLMLVLEESGIKSEDESLTLQCLCFVNRVFYCRDIIQSLSMSSILLASLYSATSDCDEKNSVVVALVKILEKVSENPQEISLDAIKNLHMNVEREIEQHLKSVRTPQKLLNRMNEFFKGKGGTLIKCWK